VGFPGDKVAQSQVNEDFRAMARKLFVTKPNLKKSVIILIMKTKLTLAVLVVLIVIVSGYLYLYYFGSGSKIDSGDLTFTELLSKEGSYKCEIKRLLDRGFAGDATISGTAYIGNNMLRVDYPKALSLIYKDKKTYNWWGEGSYNYSKDPNEGFIVEDTTYGPSTYQWDSTMVTEFSCVRWNVDESKFAPPENLVFPQRVPPLPKSN